MKRQIFVVDAHVVDSTGKFGYINGYPKTFDSLSYGGDIDKTQQRALGDMSETFGAMCKRDDRQQQTVVLSTSDGFVIESRSLGSIYEIPEPELEE